MAMTQKYKTQNQLIPRNSSGLDGLANSNSKEPKKLLDMTNSPSGLTSSKSIEETQVQRSKTADMDKDLLSPQDRVTYRTQEIFGKVGSKRDPFSSSKFEGIKEDRQESDASWESEEYDIDHKPAPGSTLQRRPSKEETEGSEPPSPQFN